MHKYAFTLFTKAFYWCLHKNLALSYGLTGKRTRKKIGQCQYFGVFWTDQKKIRFSVVCLRNSVIAWAYVPSTNLHKKSNE